MRVATSLGVDIYFDGYIAIDHDLIATVSLTEGVIVKSVTKNYRHSQKQRMVKGEEDNADDIAPETST